MLRPFLFFSGLVSLLISASACGGEAANPAAADGLLDAQMVFVGKIAAVRYGPVAQSMPPIHTVTLRVQVIDSLRGGHASGAELTINYSARQLNQPVFVQGDNFLIAASQDNRLGGIVVASIQPANDQIVKQARAAAALPVGWKLIEGKLVSPWASLGADFWPKEAGGPAADGVCSKTGRPALRVGNTGVTYKVESVPPAQSIQWTNPDGDGEYRITVTNPVDKAVDVPALLSDDKGNILWSESLVIVCQGTARPTPRCATIKAAPRATRLAPGQSVSGVVNILELANVTWPQGGYRVEFTFCLGELAATQSFYYMSRHHDVLREQANKGR